MNIANKIFNVNGFGNKGLVNTINFAANGHKFYAYKVDTEKGIYLYLSQTLCPPDATVFDIYQTIEEQYDFMVNTLKSIENVVLFTDIDGAFENESNKIVGWRIYTEPSRIDNQVWWEHYIIIRPSYVLVLDESDTSNN